MAEEPEKTCFVIAPIGDADSPQRKRSNNILRFLIEPLVTPYGYKAVRADHISESGLITTQVMQHLLNDPLVIADLAGHNPNVFYELALRHAVHKPVIQLAAAGEKLPFDVVALRTVFIDTTDMASVEDAKAELAKHIKAVEADPTRAESPVSFAIDIQRLHQSENPVERGNAEILEMLASIKSEMSGLARQVPAEQVEQVMRRLWPVSGTRFYSPTPPTIVSAQGSLHSNFDSLGEQPANFISVVEKESD